MAKFNLISNCSKLTKKVIQIKINNLNKSNLDTFAYLTINNLSTTSVLNIAGTVNYNPHH